MGAIHMDKEMEQSTREIERALQAIKAREQGIWDDPALVSYGPLATNTIDDVTYIKRKCLESFGFKVGDRDPRINTDFEGRYMVVESYEEDELPTKDGSNGPWCIVGNNLSKLIETAFNFLVGITL